MVLVAVQLSVLGLYLPPVFRRSAVAIAAPDDHFAVGPNCCVTPTGSGRVNGAGGCPTVGPGIISPASDANQPLAAPDDHFAAGPDCRVTGRASGALVVLVAVQLSVLGLYRPPVFKEALLSRPRRSFHCRSNCRVTTSCRGGVGDASCSPTIRAGIVSPARVLNHAAISSPDDHFTASPDCRVRASGNGGIGECRWSPRFIDAATRGTSYYRKRVEATLL